MIGAFNGVVKTSKIKITAMVGSDLINEINGVKNLENKGSRYAMKAKNTAKIKEMNKANRHLKNVAQNAVQNSLFPSREKAVLTQSQTGGSRYVFCSAAQAICQTISKNAKAAMQNATFCKILFFIYYAFP